MQAVAISSEAKGNASESPTPQAANNTRLARIDDAPPPPPPTDLTECAEVLEDPPGITIQPSKKAKISQSVVKSKGFTFGSHNREHATLKSYPGLSPASRTLAVNQLLGGHILSSMISAGDDAPQHVAKSFQKWHRNGKSPAIHAEAEATTLVRIIHLTIVMHESPLEALQNQPGLEVALRRLYAILYVEKSVFNGDEDRADAWSSVEHMLEVSTSARVPCDDISSETSRRVILQSKRQAALRSMSTRKSQRKPTKRSNNPNGSQNDMDNRRFQKGEAHRRTPNQSPADRSLPTLSISPSIPSSSLILQRLSLSLRFLFAGPEHPSVPLYPLPSLQDILRPLSRPHAIIPNLSEVCQNRLVQQNNATQSPQSNAYTESFLSLSPFELPGVMHTLFRIPETSFRRGIFKRIEASRLALPPKSEHLGVRDPSKFWTDILPVDVRVPFVQPTSAASFENHPHEALRVWSSCKSESSRCASAKTSRLTIEVLQPFSTSKLSRYDWMAFGLFGGPGLHNPCGHYSTLPLRCNQV
ncbi:hypothetical protein FGB62_86g016 [Gracilaria domingensis]|nr:hypothetical protein FGB62_86g016 [Gracilaria domingensis]